MFFIKVTSLQYKEWHMTLIFLDLTEQVEDLEDMTSQMSGDIMGLATMSLCSSSGPMKINQFTVI